MKGEMRGGGEDHGDRGVHGMAPMEERDGGVVVRAAAKDFGMVLSIAVNAGVGKWRRHDEAMWMPHWVLIE